MDPTLEPQSSNISGSNPGPDGGQPGGGPPGGGPNPNPNNSVSLGGGLEQDRSNRNSSSSRMSGISSTSADIETEKRATKLNIQNVVDDPKLSDRDKMLELQKLCNEKTDETASLKRERNNLKKTGVIPMMYDLIEGGRGTGTGTSTDSGAGAGAGTGAGKAPGTGPGTSTLRVTSTGDPLDSKWSSDSSDYDFKKK